MAFQSYNKSITRYGSETTSRQKSSLLYTITRSSFPSDEPAIYSEVTTSSQLSFGTVKSSNFTDDVLGTTSFVTSTEMSFADSSFLSSIYNDTNVTLSPDECDDKLELLKKEYKLLFDHTQLIRISVTWSLFLISAIGNLFVLTSLTVRRKRKHRSNAQLLMMHLTFANLAFTFFFIPIDAIWQTTVEWKGGEVLCRITNVLKQFSMYISSAIIVVMGIDRVANLISPTSMTTQRQRIRTMLIISWTFSIINAIPAGVVFSVMSKPLAGCPGYFVTQCVDLRISAGVNLKPYYVYTMIISFFAPLVCILVCYILIAIAISKMAKISKEAEKRCSLKVRDNSKRSITRKSLDRAQKMSKIVTALITATFVLCWGPYYVAGLIYWFDREDSSVPDQQAITRTATMVMLLSVYLNPCLHPLITVLLMKEVRDNLFSQCRIVRSPGPRLPPRKISSHNKKKKKASVVIRGNKNGTKELLANENGSPDPVYTGNGKDDLLGEAML